MCARRVNRIAAYTWTDDVSSVCVAADIAARASKPSGIVNTDSELAVGPFSRPHPNRPIMLLTTTQPDPYPWRYLYTADSLTSFEAQYFQCAVASVKINMAVMCYPCILYSETVGVWESLGWGGKTRGAEREPIAGVWCVAPWSMGRTSSKMVKRQSPHEAESFLDLESPTERKNLPTPLQYFSESCPCSYP